MTTDTAVAPTEKRRIPLWDTARFVAITLVVAGHAIQRLQGGSDAAAVVYLAIYSFHIPLLVLASGYFAKDLLDSRALARLVTDLALPYLVFETLWSLIRWWIKGAWPPDYTTPSWTLWFLLALVGWRLLLPLLAVTRWPLLAAVAISMLAGYSGHIDSTFALSRMLGLLPFFVLGWTLRHARVRGTDLGEWWTDLSTRAVATTRVLAIILLGGTMVALTVGLELWRAVRLKDFLFYDSAYPDFGYDQWWAGGVRLLVMAVGALLSVAVLTLVPRRAVRVSALGGATLYVYLLHTAVLYPLRESGALSAYANDVTLVLMLIASVLIALALSSKPVRTVFRPLVEPRATWLLARRHRQETG